jgi:HAD superfamily phosphoserine phosphatase-like hydrolase
MTILALFDLDHTLIPIDSDQQWGQFLCKLGLVNPISYGQKNEYFYQEYQKGTLNIAEFLEFGLAILAKYPMEQLLNIQKQYVEQIIKPNITKQAMALVNKHKNMVNVECVLVTATNSFIALPIGELLGFDEDNIIATEAHIIGKNTSWYKNKNDFQFSGKVLGTPNFRENKVLRIQQWMVEHEYKKQDFSCIFAYSDSHNDIPMLEWANIAIATNPDEKLATHASIHSWPVLNLF